MRGLNFKKIILAILCVFFISLFTGEVLLRFGEARYRMNLERAYPLDTREMSAFVILCIGESTTALGEETAYPAQLEMLLTEQIPGKRFKVINRGIPGIDTASIARDFRYNLRKHNPDMVTVMMGINDEIGCGLSEKRSFLRVMKDVIKSLRLFRTLRRLCEEKQSGDTFAFLYFELGKEYNQQRRYSLSEDVFRRIILKDPHDVKGYSELAFSYRAQGNFTQAIEILQKALLLDNRAYWLYLELAGCYIEKQDYLHAEEMFRKAFALNPREKEVHMGLAQCLIDQNKITEAEEIYQAVIADDPVSAEGYFESAGFYKQFRRYAESRKMFEKALELDPHNEMSLIGLGICYQEEGLSVEAEKMFNKTLELKEPLEEEAYYQAGDYYKSKGDYFHAEEIFKKAIAYFPKQEHSYEALIECYLDRKDFCSAERLLKKLLELNPENEWALRCMGALFFDKGSYKKAEEYYGAARKLVNKPRQGIRRSYQFIKREVLKRHIPLVCVQYPVRKVERLKKLIGSGEKIIFVDNETVFKDLLKMGSFDDYFVDYFAGNFGHFNSRSNRIVAEQIAQSIRKEYFNKK